MLRRLALVTLLLAANAEAEVVTHRFWIATDTTGTRHQAAFFYVCDTQVELPAAATEGDQAWAVDTNKFFVWDGAATIPIPAPGIRVYAGSCFAFLNVGSATLALANASFTIVERP